MYFSTHLSIYVSHCCTTVPQFVVCDLFPANAVNQNKIVLLIHWNKQSPRYSLALKNALIYDIRRTCFADVNTCARNWKSI